jgi:hypothetical protein
LLWKYGVAVRVWKIYPSFRSPMCSRRRSEIVSRVKRDHAHRAIGAQTDAEQTGRRRDGIGKRAESSLRGRFSGTRRPGFGQLSGQIEVAATSLRGHYLASLLFLTLYFQLHIKTWSDIGPTMEILWRCSIGGLIVAGFSLLSARVPSLKRTRFDAAGHAF